VLFQPCRSSSLLVTFKMSCYVSMNEINDDDLFFVPSTRFYARQQNASRVFAIVWASVCLSVTLVICIKTVQARITKFSLWAAPRSLVYRDKISGHWVQGFPSNDGVEEGYPLKDVILPLLARIM